MLQTFVLVQVFYWRWEHPHFYIQKTNTFRLIRVSHKNDVITQKPTSKSLFRAQCHYNIFTVFSVQTSNWSFTSYYHAIILLEFHPIWSSMPYDMINKSFYKINKYGVTSSNQKLIRTLKNLYHLLDFYGFIWKIEKYFPSFYYFTFWL